MVAQAALSSNVETGRARHGGRIGCARSQERPGAGLHLQVWVAAGAGGHSHAVEVVARLLSDLPCGFGFADGRLVAWVYPTV